MHCHFQTLKKAAIMTISPHFGEPRHCQQVRTAIAYADVVNHAKIVPRSTDTIGYLNIEEMSSTRLLRA